jgi:hypothetical protein
MKNLFIITTFLLMLFSFSCSKMEKNHETKMISQKSPTNSSNPALIDNETNVISLRVTGFADQEDSQFCWVFSSMTILESMFLEKNPQVSEEDINLSRWYFKESTSSDKNQGAIIDAVNFHSKEIGLVSNSDYKRSHSGQIVETTFLGELMSPFELREKLIGNQEFWSYAISSKLSGWNPHPDPTARVGNKAFFIPRSEITRIVRNSLEQQAPIGYWFESHVVVIYGAEYDLDGNALKYYIKDSYPPYFYEKKASWVHKKIKTLSGISNLESL